MILSPVNSQLATAGIGELAIDYAIPLPNSTVVPFPVLIRYIKRPKNGLPHPYALTLAERDRLLVAGHGILLVFESYAGRAKEGYQAGINDGQYAYAQAQWLGYPLSLPILAAVDFDVTGSTVLAAVDYCRGFYTQQSARGDGLYGDSDILNAVGDIVGPTLTAVQVTNLWSHKAISPYATMLQLTAGSTPQYDADAIIKPVSVWVASHSIQPSPQSPTVTWITKTEDKNMFTNIEPFTYSGVQYPPHHVYWRYNDTGTPIHIAAYTEVMARGGDANAQPFTNAELATITGLPV